MSSMFFIVKGNRYIAEAEAIRRGISVEIDTDSKISNETYCYAPMIDRPKIIDWYSLDAGIAKSASPGDCLWYSQRD